jgi:hypothetical protein
MRATFPILLTIGLLNVPFPLPKKTTTPLVDPSAQSNFPSALKSPITTEFELFTPDEKFEGGKNPLAATVATFSANTTDVLASKEFPPP